MPISLLRVDERLIHGQVVVAWGQRLHPARYVVVDDALAASGWEQELFQLAVDGSAELVFTTVDEARAQLAGWRTDQAATIVLTRDLDAMAALARGGQLAGHEVNLGGIHPGPGRTEVRPYLFLGDHERACIRDLSAAGVQVSGRDVPDATRVPVAALLA